MSQLLPGTFIYISCKMGKQRNWTKEEKEYLQDKWGVVSIGTLAKNLGRSEGGIINMARRMKLGAFLQNGEYITLNELQQAVSGRKVCSYDLISWVQNRGLPVKTKRVGKNSFRVVYIDDFWEWAEKNKNFVDFTKLELNVLGKEPDWLAGVRRRQLQTKRKYRTEPWTQAEDAHLKFLIDQYRYTVSEISEKMQRTCGAIQRRCCDIGLMGRPVKADNHNEWTETELDVLCELIKAGASYEYIAEEINRSTKAIRGLVYRMYLTENIDKAAAIIGNGKWGDNRPPRKIRHKTLNTEERLQVKKDMTQFVQILKGKICSHYEDNDYWQREICQHWNNGCDAGEVNCDSCSSFQRIRTQYCKRCGKSFLERGENNFCSACRQQRKKQAQRKYAIVNGKRIYNFEEV